MKAYITGINVTQALRFPTNLLIFCLIAVPVHMYYVNRIEDVQLCAMV